MWWVWSGWDGEVGRNIVAFWPNEPTGGLLENHSIVPRKTKTFLGSCLIFDQAQVQGTSLLMLLGFAQRVHSPLLLGQQPDQEDGVVHRLHISKNQGCSLGSAPCGSNRDVRDVGFDTLFEPGRLGQTELPEPSRETRPGR